MIDRRVLSTDSSRRPTTVTLLRWLKRAAWLTLLLAGGPALAAEVGTGVTAALDNPGFTVAMALLAGFACQALGRHMRVPGIVLLLGAGVLLGPELLDVVRPSTLGPRGEGLAVLVGFAVAVILFEGGLNLDIRRLRREQRPIQLLITVGALVTWIGAALCAKAFLPWEWTTAILFGSLVIVTGPTVITPLLRRLKVKRTVSTILEAEGLLIDAVGAVIAFVMLDVLVTNPQGFGQLVRQLGSIFELLAAGVLLGLVGGLLILLPLRRRHVVPEGLENIFVLSMVLVLFEVSNAIWHESGIAAATVAGIVLGNSRTPVRRELREFKEQLTVLLIGMLFVLLSGDVRMADVQALGWGGALTVAGLVLLVRPLNVLAGTFGSGLNWKEKAFIAWIGPRGIVAAAVASLFATKLEPELGNQIRALVFLTIAVTVTTAGVLGSPVAWLLGLRRKANNGWVVVGANDLGRALGLELKRADEEVVLIDSNAEAIAKAEELTLRAIWGNALEERTLLRAEIDTRAGVVGLTPNGKLNMLFAQRAKEEGGPQRMFVAVESATRGGAAAMVHEAGAEMLFGRPLDVDAWSTRLRRKTAVIGYWRLEKKAKEPQDPEPEDAKRETSVLSLSKQADELYLPLIRLRGGKAQPVGDSTRFRVGDRVGFVLQREQPAAREALTSAGWIPAEADTDEAGAKQTAPAPTP